jgi:hypothetical protein
MECGREARSSQSYIQAEPVRLWFTILTSNVRRRAVFWTEWLVVTHPSFDWRRADVQKTTTTTMREKMNSDNHGRLYTLPSVDTAAHSGLYCPTLWTKGCKIPPSYQLLDPATSSVNVVRQIFPGDK